MFEIKSTGVMPVGLCNAPAIFQRAMTEIRKEHTLEGYCLVCIHNTIIFSPSLHLHFVQFDSVFKTLVSHNFYSQLYKCEWAKKQIQYFRQVVSGLGVLLDSG